MLKRGSINESAPEARSVALSALPAPSAALLHSDLPSPLLLSNGKNNNNNNNNIKQHHSPFLAEPTSRDDAATTSPSFAWKLDTPLQPCPLEYGLQRHTTFSTDLSPERVLQRLSRHLRKSCCDCSFQGNRLDVQTLHAKFAIFLWKDDDDDSSTRTLIEMQRRQGCGVAMQCFRRHFFRALMDDDDDTTNNTEDDDVLRLPRMPAVPEACKRQMLLATTKVEHENSEPQQRVEQAMELLQSSCSYQMKLGLDQLLFVTEQHDDMADYIRNSPFLWNSIIECIQESYTFEEHKEPLVLSAWCVLARILQSVYRNLSCKNHKHQKSQSSATAASSSHKNFTWEEPIYHAVRRCLQRAHERPQEATFAIQCWYWMDSPKATHDSEALVELVQAHAYGKNHHQGLEKASYRMIQLLSFGASARDPVSL